MTIVRPLIQTKTTKISLEGIEFQLRRIADALEHIAYPKPEVTASDFDVDEFSTVLYTDEEGELVQQHLDKRIGGVVVNDLGL